MTSLTGTIDELYGMCHEFLCRDETQWTKICEFINSYRPSNAIQWYIKEPFVFELLNKVLRSSDIDKMITLRLLIRDLYYQLREEQKNFPDTIVTVYRGQAMALRELNKIRTHIGNLISMNSFLSTSKDRDVARMFAESSTDPNDNTHKRILFEIHATTRRIDAKPFAEISHFGSYTDEKEILFMLGSVFKLQNIVYDENEKLWIVKLILCGENDNELKDVLKSMKSDIAECPNLTSLGLLLKKMGKIDRAAKCFQRHLNSLASDDFLRRASCYWNLGNIAREKGYYKEALENLNMSLDIKSNLSSIDKTSMGDLYNDIGTVYNYIPDYSKALEAYQQALKYKLESVGHDHLTTASVYDNMGTIYRAPIQIRFGIKEP
ncbi:unnamed protein product [Rotaria sordida]|uniref:Uncharacterized protein n=1 Tax=Rotaria sordida TaxID=392033 RepID=A0A819SFV9_9BILA|nr:unnamed protein product [Rotaria sordida]CAF0826708.1 unnamed protein product [Rotaria sordida]CAF3907166.1 unnamed protein product [Rotaria sordida]CAF4063668.1 unnamed protein product [Rotaria sordida]